jgi:hypothetical protein
MSFIRPQANVVRRMWKTPGITHCAIGDGLSPYVWRTTPPNPSTGILKVKNGNDVKLEEIRIGADYGMPLNPENYEYNVEVCNKNYKGEHKKECYRWVEKTKVECKCGGWVSFPYKG